MTVDSTAKRKTTKGEFERRMNEVYGHDYQRWGNGNYGARTRPIGTYLRNQDPWMFDQDYQEWLEQGDEKYFATH